MSILTKRNGVALVAVLAVLLILTLLIPAMFTMSETATRAAMRGLDEQRASYLARTMVEMSVAAFQDFYDVYDDAKTQYKTEISNGIDNGYPTVCSNYDTFTTRGTMSADTVYMFQKNGVDDNIPSGDSSDIGKPQDQWGKYDTLDDCKAAWDNYQQNAVIYKTTNAAVDGYTLVGHSDCTITYDEVCDYYKIENGEFIALVDNEETTGVNEAEQEYKTIKNNLEAAAEAGQNTATMTQCHKEDRKEIRFYAVATIGDKTYKNFARRCLVILPTKPADENWIVPASIESNQIFVESSQATGILALEYNDYFNKGSKDTKATSQVVYSFSCTGNMVISGKGMKVKDGETYVDYNDYVKTHPGVHNQLEDFSLGVHPVTTTIKPENDPTFSCIKTNNMSSWSGSAQKDNFVMFSATNGIQVDMPVNLLINPCRTGRIGDGIHRNYPLYKIMAFQAPNIVFKGNVNNFVSLWKKSTVMEGILDVFGEGYDARRVSSIILSAPENTPYSYINRDRNNQICKAGKVIFLEDAYVWLVPFSEDGSNYKTQTVYYKGSDIKLYKMANKGDVYFFNSEVPTKGGSETTGFSMTAYFMDVLYNKMVDDTDYGWKLWSALKDNAFGFAQSALMPQDYVADDFHKIGNIYDGTGGRIPVIDDFYVVWDS